MKKLKLIIEREFLAKVRNRSFIVMTFLSPLIMIGMIALVAFLSKSSLEKRSVVAYVDESELFTEEDFSGRSIDFMNLSEVGIEKAKTIVMEANQDGLLYIPKKDSLNEMASSIQFFSKETPGMVLMGDLENTIERKLEKEKMEQLGIDLQKLDQANIDVEINMSNFVGERSSKMINGIKVAMGMGAGYLIMMFIIIYGAMVMRSVIEEKTSRIVEVIISSVKPFQLMLGKVLGTAGAGLLQFFIWAVILLVLFFGLSFFFGVELGGMNQAQMTPEQMEILKQNDFQFAMEEVMKLPIISMFFWFILFFLGGYLLYSSLYAAIGSAVDNETDTQQFMMPVIMPLMIGVYVGFATVINDPHGTIATIFSFIPFTSPIVMLMRIPFGVPWWEIVISLIILYITFFVVIWIAAKIYRVGILMYGKKASYKELWKWIRY
ncbi:ABC transporter permease [Namhaeicola litoreus]|uniref:ABC transporter permease n=1 Tax=Namhaeicola litoreus TaxID=1052145 RepID=A0ABW3Y2K7_9FLAO